MKQIYGCNYFYLPDIAELLNKKKQHATVIIHLERKPGSQTSLKRKLAVVDDLMYFLYLSYTNLLCNEIGRRI